MNIHASKVKAFTSTNKNSNPRFYLTAGQSKFNIIKQQFSYLHNHMSCICTVSICLDSKLMSTLHIHRINARPCIHRVCIKFNQQVHSSARGVMVFFLFCDVVNNIHTYNEMQHE